MRRVALLGVLAVLVLAAPAGAKLRMSLALGTSSPTAGRPLTVVLRTERPLLPGAHMQVVAVAPGRNLDEVVGAVTGASSRVRATIPRDGFGVSLVRIAPKRRRAFVRFPAPGKWLLVVPNGGTGGYTIPPVVVRELRVSAG